MPIQRNAILALAHFKDPENIGPLAELLKKDARPVIRGTAAWALGKIGGNEAAVILRECLAMEQEELVRTEIESAIAKLEKLGE